MARCYKCGKKAVSGNNRSHSNVATKRKFRVNLQKTITPEGKKEKICTSCLRTANKVVA